MNDLISRSALLEKIQPVDFLYGDDEAPAYSGMAVSAGDIESAPAVDAVEVVRCKDCNRRYDADECPMCYLIDGESYDYTADDGYCDRGEKRSE